MPFYSKNLAIISFVILPFIVYGQVDNKGIYEKTFNELKAMLEGQQECNFKKAVFLTENAYHGGSLNYEKFCNPVLLSIRYKKRNILAR
jgi:hypothetical protein